MLCYLIDFGNAFWRLIHEYFTHLKNFLDRSSLNHLKFRNYPSQFLYIEWIERNPSPNQRYFSHSTWTLCKWWYSFFFCCFEQHAFRCVEFFSRIHMLHWNISSKPNKTRLRVHELNKKIVGKSDKKSIQLALHIEQMLVCGVFIITIEFQHSLGWTWRLYAIQGRFW